MIKLLKVTQIYDFKKNIVSKIAKTKSLIVTPTETSEN